MGKNLIIVGVLIPESEIEKQKQYKNTLIYEAEQAKIKNSCEHLDDNSYEIKSPKYCPECGTKVNQTKIPFKPAQYKNKLVGYGDFYEHTPDLLNRYDYAPNLLNIYSKFSHKEDCNYYYYDEDNCDFDCKNNYYNNLEGFTLPIGYDLVCINYSFYILYKCCYVSSHDHHEFIIDDDFLEFRNKTTEFCDKLGIEYECGVYFQKSP